MCSRQELTSIPHLSDIQLFWEKRYNPDMKIDKVSTSDSKICLTAGGILIHQGKILLIKHKKLGVWLSPGGHIEDKEMPHQAAEREFWEETAIKVTAVSGQPHSITDTQQTEYLPTPIYTNIHWISKQNYQDRLEGKQVKGRGCERHLAGFYLVKPVGSVEYKQNVEETDGIGWFTLDDVQQLDTYPEVKQEVKLAFELVPPSKAWRTADELPPSSSLADALEV